MSLETEGSADALDRDELYSVVRTAVEDALLDVLGTVALVAFALALVAAGASAAFTSPSTVGVLFGVALVVAGFAVAARALDVVGS